MNRETDPSGFWGSIVSAGGALVALLVAFGVPLTDDQQAALLGALIAAGPIITQLLIRRDAWSPVSHFRELRDVEAMTPPDAEDGTIDLHAIVTVLLILILAVVLVRLL